MLFSILTVGWTYTRGPPSEYPTIILCFRHQKLIIKTKYDGRVLTRLLKICLEDSIRYVSKTYLLVSPIGQILTVGWTYYYYSFSNLANYCTPIFYKTRPLMLVSPEVNFFSL